MKLAMSVSLTPALPREERGKRARCASFTFTILAKLYDSHIMVNGVQCLTGEFWIKKSTTEDRAQRGNEKIVWGRRITIGLVRYSPT